MRIAILNVDYEPFLASLHEEYEARGIRTYADRLDHRMATRFGVADFYTHALRELGHDAIDVHANNDLLSSAWAAEHGMRPSPSPLDRARRRIADGRPWLSWHRDVVASQLREFQPDVVVNQAMDWAGAQFLRQVVPAPSLVVGQHASPPLPPADHSCYDLVISSWPPLLDRFHRESVATFTSRLGFDPRAAADHADVERDIPLSFVGSIAPMHQSRLELLEALCRAFPFMRVHTADIDAIPPGSPIHACLGPPAWGRDMYEILRRSRVTINHHGIVGDHANNLRLYEATGCGAALVTDRRSDLHELFDVGTEVLDYGSSDEAVSAVAALLDDPDAVDRLARSGRDRTLRDHTWTQRMLELLPVLEDMLP